jgi:HSP20 family protein
MTKRPSYFLPTASPAAETTWQPSVDVYRCEEGWLVKCDLAGVRPEDIHTKFHGRRLTISGVRRDLSLVTGHRAYSLEIAYDRFERTIELPCDFERVNLQVDYRDGMLLVAIRLATNEDRKEKCD